MPTEREWGAPVAVTGVWLVRLGNNVEVLVEIDGEWRTAIVESYDAPFSHEVTAAGLRLKPRTDWLYAECQRLRDLRAEEYGDDNGERNDG